MKHVVRTGDFLLAFTAIVVGMAFTFVALSSSSVSYRILVALLALGVLFTYLSLKVKSRRRADRETSVCKETLLVDAEASGQLLFAPESPMTDPVLHLTAHGRPLLVEDVWHDDVSLVVAPQPIVAWRRGIVYHGVVDAKRTLRVVVRNAGYAPAVVRASLSAKKTKETR